MMKYEQPIMIIVLDVVGTLVEISSVGDEIVPASESDDFSS